MDDFFTKSAEWASVACYAAAALGCVYALVALWAAHGFVRVTRAPANNFRANNFPAMSLPAVTILKPLHGAEPDLYATLAHFCTQDYPGPVQIVFGVDDPADPAAGIVRKLIADYPDRDLDLVINSRRHGTNRKVSNLINMAAEARHEVLAVSDSDIIVDRDYLSRIIASLDQPGIGLVTCLYRGVAADGVWAGLAAAAIDYHFLPNVLVGLKAGLAEPCFGSTIALRKETLAAIGGFKAVVEQLADDYALGALVRRAGLGVAIPGFTVAHVCSEASAGDLFRHELRWARTIRSVDPLGFAGLVITHPLPLALLGLALGGVTAAGIGLAVAAIACRFMLQAQLDRTFHLRDGYFWLGPLRDVLSFAVFVASFFGRDVEWRGRRYGIQADSTLAYYGEVES